MKIFGMIGFLCLVILFVLASCYASQITQFLREWRNKARKARNKNSHGGLANMTWLSAANDWHCDKCGLPFHKYEEISCAVYRHTNIDHKTIGTP